MSVPERLVVVVGTGTEVGKTWVAGRVLERLRAAGVAVAARKPVQSHEPGDPTTDARELAAATGEDPSQVCPPHRSYEVAMAPPMAAEALDRPPFDLSDLVDEISWPDSVEVGLVETAGGPRSPMASDGADAVALVAAVMPDVVVLVADAGLGTINQVRLSVAALDPVVETRSSLELVVVLNRFDPTDELHRANLAWLTRRDGLAVLSTVDDLVDRLRPA
jgi:dethiobiotin synthetase